MNNVLDFFNNIGKQATDAYKSVFEPLWNQPPAIDSPKDSLTDTDEESPQHPVEQLIPLPNAAPGSSLDESLAILKLNAMIYAENKVRSSYASLKEVQTKNQAMTRFLEHLTAHSAEDGSYTIKDDNAKKIFTAAVSAGLMADKSKVSFTKDERDILVRNTELHSRNLETDLKLKVNEVQEGIHIRNTIFQELKTMWDKKNSALSKILANIGGR
ncbi:MAG: hypothetical protein JSR46_04505 [Verrucomicrobia bacterium]|nr:hypothetical protein [Verrucomicrobiota bacterium]